MDDKKLVNIGVLLKSGAMVHGMLEAEVTEESRGFADDLRALSDRTGKVYVVRDAVVRSGQTEHRTARTAFFAEDIQMVLSAYLPDEV